MSYLETRAREFASRRHAAIGQKRKYTGEDYIHHPAAVVTLVRSVPHSEEMLAAAWLHDTVEDTDATFEDIERQFGREVAVLVEMLTDVSKPEHGNRAARKAIDRAHTARASPEAKTIKLADLIDNSMSITSRDQKFARVYMAEMAALLEVLTEGDQALYAMATEIIERYNLFI
jgi:guanosine-3',5'-bis(diphosphate) 3'-pyrophosphohydrolase